MRSQSSANETMLLFPEDMMWEILSRLPVKSLVRFRCVSTSWCCLISTKSFVQFHLKNSRNLASKQFISMVRLPSLRLINCPLQSLLCGSAVDFEYSANSRINRIRVVGCCNGIVCIAHFISDRDIFLWNPSTRKYKKVADDNDIVKRCSYKFGFGFDELNGDYKIVRVLADSISGDDSRVKIYSLRSNSWKGVDDVFGDDSISDNGKFVNGKLHWIRGRGRGLNPDFEIVSLDLGSEMWASFALPMCVEFDYCPVLGVLEERLCVIFKCEILILKEYGVTESWEKLLIITRPDSTLFPCLTPLFVGPKGEIFLFYESRLVAYDPRYYSYKCFNKRNFDGVFDAQVYSESLVSLGDGELDASVETIVYLIGTYCPLECARRLTEYIRLRRNKQNV